MSLYSAKLFAKNIPRVDSSELDALIESDSSVSPIVPNMTEGKVKNLRCVKLGDLMEYIGGGVLSEVYTKIFDPNENIGSIDGNTIKLSASRLKYKYLCFIYGTSNSTSGSRLINNKELNILKDISPNEIRIVELPTGAITISNIVDNLGGVTSFNVDSFINNILMIYGVANTDEPTPPTPSVIDINSCSIESIQDQYYTGSEITPSVVISYNSNQLIENIDYTLSYTDNINIGVARCIITGIGNYTGSKQVSFNIVPGIMNITSSPGLATYPTSAHITVSGYPEGSTIVYGTDTTYSYGTTNPEISQEGTITIYFKVTNPNYIDFEGIDTVTILPNSGLTGGSWVCPGYRYASWIGDKWYKDYDWTGEVVVVRDDSNRRYKLTLVEAYGATYTAYARYGETSITVNAGSYTYTFNWNS